jgi:hypothetical protein
MAGMFVFGMLTGTGMFERLGLLIVCRLSTFPYPIHSRNMALEKNLWILALFCDDSPRLITKHVVQNPCKDFFLCWTNPP